MKEENIYKKTLWVDGETPVSAENLNKIENALQELSEKLISPSDFLMLPDCGLIKDTKDGAILFKIDNDQVLRTSGTISEINVLRDKSDLKINEKCINILIDDDRNCELFLSDKKYTPKISSSNIMMTSGISLEEYVTNECNKLRGDILDLRKALEGLLNSNNKNN